MESMAKFKRDRLIVYCIHDNYHRSPDIKPQTNGTVSKQMRFTQKITCEIVCSQNHRKLNRLGLLVSQ